MVLDTALLNTHHYKVHIKGKVGPSRERSSTLPLHLGVVATQKGAFGSPLTTVASEDSTSFQKIEEKEILYRKRHCETNQNLFLCLKLFVLCINVVFIFMCLPTVRPPASYHENYSS